MTWGWVEGKTAISLTALEPHHLPVLVVAPKRVAENVWEEERDLWRPDLTLAVAKGSPAARGKILAADNDVTVIGRDNVKDLDSLKHRPWRTLILDELSSFKSRGVRWKVMNRLLRQSNLQHVWGLTGTPAANGYLDLHAQVLLIDGHNHRLGNLTTYRSRYFRPGRQLPNGVIIEWILREEDGASDKIKAKLADTFLAMESDGRVKLPDITFNDVKVDLPRRARDAYRKLESELVVDLRDILGAVHTAGSAAMLSARLSQITAGFIYDDDVELNNQWTELHTEKVQAVREICEAPHEGGVMVFYRYRAEAAMLYTGLEDIGVRNISDPGAIEDWNRGRVPILLAHPASAGHGLNLQHGGHTQVWSSPTWDLEHWEQGIKRLHRQGQTHPVVVHTVLAKKSIDYLVRQRLRRKADVQDDLLAYLESPL